MSRGYNYEIKANRDSRGSYSPQGMWRVEGVTARAFVVEQQSKKPGRGLSRHMTAVVCHGFLLPHRLREQHTPEEISCDWQGSALGGGGAE